MKLNLLATCALSAVFWTAPAFAGLFCQSAAECDDADPCTQNLCIAGSCSNPDRQPGTACTSDNNDCTRDVCLPDGGGGVSCQHPALQFGSACTDDGNDCTLDRCEPDINTGQPVCNHPPVQFGSPCADEGNPCTFDRCAPPPSGFGPPICSHDPAPGGNPCTSDGNSCTQDICGNTGSGMQCMHIAILGGSACDDDGNDCTNDFCGVSPTGGPTCIHQPLIAGSACDDESPCTQFDACDPTGECVGTTPQLDCRTAAGASITIRNGEQNPRDLVDFKWTKGTAVEPFELGDPRTTTDYTLCVFDGNGRLKLSASVPPGGQCGDNECWKATGKGYQYADKLRLADGIGKLKLSSGAIGKAQVQVRGQGRFLSLPTLPLAGGTTRVQVINDETGVCFDAQFATSKANAETKFQAKYP